MLLSQAATDLYDEAVGRRHRVDPAVGRAGGPAGNARLTAWTGVLLLVLIAAELVTLLDVRGLISWHIVIGTVLLPVALLKTGSTGWRVLRYYTGHRPYRSAGPPQTALRVLGPLVVVSTMTLLGSGILLVLLGPETSRTELVSLLGQRVDWVRVHQVLFLGWGVLVGVHVLARLVPAWTALAGRPGQAAPAGARTRLAALVVTVVVAVVSAWLVLAAGGGWRHENGPVDRGRDRPPAVVGQPH